MSDFGNRMSMFFTKQKLNGEKVFEYIDALHGLKVKNLPADDDVNHIRASTTLINKSGYKDYYSFIDALYNCILSSKESGAKLISLPQYIGIIPLYCTGIGKDLIKVGSTIDQVERIEFLKDTLKFCGDWLMDIYVNTYCTLAKKYGINIHAGSILVSEKGKVYNRSYIFSPMGDIILAQDKITPTKEEILWGIAPADNINIATTNVGAVAILGDEDSLYYENVKIVREMGAKLILYSSVQGDKSKVKLINESLSWRSDEQGVFILQSSYADSLTDPHCRVICPTAMSRDLDGVYFTSNILGSHTSSLTYSRLQVALDNYSTDKNQNFYNKILREIY